MMLIGVDYHPSFQTIAYFVEANLPTHRRGSLIEVAPIPNFVERLAYAILFEFKIAVQLAVEMGAVRWVSLRSQRQRLCQPSVS